MRNLLPHFIGFLIGIFVPLLGNSQSLNPKLESRFATLKFDTLYISVDQFWGEGKKLPRPLRIDNPHEPPSYIDCLGTFSLDQSHRYRCYLVGEKAKETVRLCIVDTLTDSVMLVIDAAAYKHIPNMMQSTTRTWVLDIDGDGLLEICVETTTKDYEFEVEGAANTSGTLRYCYKLVAGRLDYQLWPAGLALAGRKQ